MFEFLNSGKLEKLKINGYDTIDFTGSPKVFQAFINPDEFTINYTSQIAAASEPGQIGSTANFLSSSPLELSLKFYLDGTKASGVLTDANGAEATVAQKIIEFYTACGYNSDKHQVRYVQIVWGSLSLLRFDPHVFQGCLKSVSINYKLFNSNGTPLRAIVNASFVEATKPETRESGGKASSPDLTHIRTVGEGDTLPAMAQKIYGDFSYYLEVAKANGLEDFRNLQPGMKIFFPPFDKNVKTKKLNG